MRCLWKLSFIATVDVFPPVVRQRKSVLLSVVSISTRSASPRDFLQRARVISFPRSCRVPYVVIVTTRPCLVARMLQVNSRHTTLATRYCINVPRTSLILNFNGRLSRDTLGQGLRHREFDCFLSCSGCEEVRALLHPSSVLIDLA